ncbi:uncharacterized protein LOC108741654 isoform X2 [Agrilus planipennis]|uniref:Uncharacterized protein LOC108741654 isoform X2 n=1 Tax=Agrilus planipennis TaxID=224129 RepID=A0A1W4X7K8_AGRPL|nr:uncharacterized protein LOC108741654 isoform X2 [Agrilus planipennis]
MTRYRFSKSSKSGIYRSKLTFLKLTEMSTTGQQYCLRWNNHRTNLLSVFDELLQNESFTDVTLACDGGNPVKCHKMVLAACSPYFQALFTGLPCKHPIVVLKDVKYSEIKAILEYMYRGEVNVAQDQLAALLKVAEALKVKGLVEENRSGESNVFGREKDEESLSQHSSPSISTTSANIQIAQSTSSSSPPHSTNTIQYSKNYNIYNKSSVERNSRMNLPMWAVPGLPLPHHPPPIPPQSHPHAAATAAAAMLSTCYEAAATDMSPLKRKKLSSLLMNRDTPILRTVLGQGQVESSEPVSLVCHSENHSSPGNGPEQESSDKLMKNEPSEDAQSPYTDFAMMDDEDKSRPAVPSTSPQSYTNELRSSGIATYVPAQKPEWKRYKQYTRNDIMSAIEAVRNGMSALQAARKYGVPSRTLYDKVKKLGITTSRPFKRGSNGSSGCFPYGISGTSSPYGALSENEDPGVSNHPALLEASHFLHALDGRGNDEREALAAMAVAAAAHAVATSHSSSPNTRGDRSPSPTMMKYMHHSNMSPSSAHESNDDPHTNGTFKTEHDDDDNQVEDLSMGRKQESRVIMPPMNQVSTIIKKDEIVKDLRDEGRREVGMDEVK